MTRSAAPVTTLPGFFGPGPFVRTLVSLAKAYMDRREVRNLAELDERMLKDIGLTRDDVVSALAEPLHHRPSWVLVRCTRPTLPAPRPAAAHNVRPVVQLVSRA
ncbi:DUF1127 domain-containing protein [Microvirga guangxiensis]|uniref:Uncharacterized conserved protein YjiS, DUF1127 family n=1 Tax=Microvirga guangxiensis TaxID=549386 RepID=A0A1G5JLJ6_9HYPH|nr:DUF1127 domain-containing protein [Microvirga guangxiensis]SCY88770.1 Uncharacterized conserved protein YjiS, DUF1127 family [Microvirga guangxiensis]